MVNAAVPVKFVETDNDLVMPTNHVIQNKGVAALVDDVKISKILELGSDEPLIRFKVTKFIKLGVTAIGLSQHHSIGTFPFDNFELTMIDLHISRGWLCRFEFSSTYLSNLSRSTFLGSSPLLRVSFP